MKTLGIIGLGTIGLNIQEKLKSQFNIVTYDKDHSKSTCRTLFDLIEQVTTTFLCIPIPIKKNGEYDLYIIRGVLQEINGIVYALKKENFIVYIKSIIPIDLVEKLNQEFTNINIIFDHDVFYTTSG
jgi:hypothetical protein